MRFITDIQHAARLWARSPGFSAVAVLTIAIGIGATTAIFGQVNAVFRTPLPVARPAELRLVAWMARAIRSCSATGGFGAVQFGRATTSAR